MATNKASNKKATSKKARGSKGATDVATRVSEMAPLMRKLLKRRDGVSVAEAVDETGLCKKSVRKLMGELNAKPTDYLGYYKA